MTKPQELVMSQYNLEILKKAEEDFFDRYPGGFNHPDLVAIKKKHNMEKAIEQAQGWFTKEAIARPQEYADNMVKLLTKSSMVSLFEKPKFRDFVKSLSLHEKEALATGLHNFLHVDEEQGFQMMLDILIPGKLAKWSVISCWGAYIRPDFDVFCKPTTVKGVVKFFELPDLIYKPRPSYDFYKVYRETINSMKKQVDKDFSPYNAAFSGFLMMSMGMY
jgi:uncharacterized protein YehS (DUF1456 family)